MDKIIEIESSGNPLAYNVNSSARGLCQITPICLRDYNSYHKVKYSLEDMYDPIKNREVGNWYMNVRIPQLLKYYGYEDTTRNRLIAYNWGISNIGKELPKETKDYINKYNKGVRNEV